MTGRVTMSDVAREAGVSLMTVSRVVNNKGEVSPTTRQRVLEIVERLDYRPSGIARGLATKRTGTLGLVVPDVANPFFAEVARGAEHVAYAQGYNVFLCNTEEDIQRELHVLASLEEKRVDGVVVTRHPAVVLVNRQLDVDEVGSVSSDDEVGGQLATHHLLQAGHQAVGFLAGPLASRSGRKRAAGYRAALAAAGVPHRPAWVRHCTPVVAGGQEAARTLLAAHPKVTALFCYNDLVAVGALQTCAALGRRVPGDLAVVGFDDIPLAALVTPALTTCHVPRYELGAQAMGLLLARVQGAAEECAAIVLQPELIVRDSAP
jgi:LacI family transcriptional regulator